MGPRGDEDDDAAVATRPSLDDVSPAAAVVATLLVWVAFVVVVVPPLSLTRFERNAVVLACGVAVLAAGIAVRLHRPDRPMVVLYVTSPFVVTAVSLPPVVAVLLSGQYPDIPVSGLPHVVAAIEWTLLDPIGLQQPFANTVHREGFGYTICWLLYSVPAGWLLGSAILQARFLAGDDL